MENTGCNRHAVDGAEVDAGVLIYWLGSSCKKVLNFPVVQCVPLFTCLVGFLLVFWQYPNCNLTWMGKSWDCVCTLQILPDFFLISLPTTNGDWQAQKTLSLSLSLSLSIYIYIYARFGSKGYCSVEYVATTRKAFGHLPTHKQSSIQYHSPSFDPLHSSYKLWPTQTHQARFSQLHLPAPAHPQSFDVATLTNIHKRN